MKGKLVWLVIIFIIIAIIFSIVGNKSVEVEDFKPLEINVGDEFTYIDYGTTMYVLNYLMEDVTGDNTKDMIIAIGEKDSIDSVSAKNIDAVIYEPNENKFYNLKLKKFDGEAPKIDLYDLTGDGILDIALMVNDENGNIMIRVISKQNNEFKEILKSRDNKGIVFTGNFVDGFKVYLKCSKYNKEVNLDLQDRKQNYITKLFFDDAGRLLKSDAKVTTTSFCKIEFVQLDGYYGIQTSQRIIGFDKDDLLDEITVIWKYENGKWNVKEAKGNLVGNLLY